MIKFTNLSANPSCVAFDLSNKQRQIIKGSSLFSLYRFKFKQFSSLSSKDEKTYSVSDEVAQGCGEVTILSGRSLRNLVARYPYRSRYVLFEINAFSIPFYFGLLGFVRRYMLGLNNINSRITYLGISKIAPKSSYYAYLRNPNATVTSHYSINSDIGFKGFLDYLNNTKLKYVVLRFFEQLPNENRKGGDLDILVEDKLESIASDFLTANPGVNMVDMYSVHSPANASRIPYHTPYLSQKILDEYVLFRGYKVPSPDNYLYSFIYHCLYHKGLSSGIPSAYASLSPSLNPDNDYLAKIQELAQPLGLCPGQTLEQLDAFMSLRGWRPHTDTLDLLASTNKWLSHHLKHLPRHPEVTLTICVLKKGFFESFDFESFSNKTQEIGFKILNHEALRDERLFLAENHLRGGNWSATNDPRYLPSDILILFDISADGIYCRQHGGSYDPRPKKECLRKTFDTHGESMIHMTDNTHQTLEYIDVLYPKSQEHYLDQIKDYDSSSPAYSLNFLKIFTMYLRSNCRSLNAGLFSFFKNIV